MILPISCHVLEEKKKETLSIQTDENPKEKKSRPTLIEGLKKVHLDGPEKTVQLGVSLSEGHAKALALLLIKFRELLTWKPSDMLGISKEVIAHEFKLDPIIW